MATRTRQKLIVSKRVVPRRALQTMLDNNPIVRKKMVERVALAATRKAIPVAVLHTIAQTLEQWGDDEEE